MKTIRLAASGALLALAALHAAAAPSASSATGISNIAVGVIDLTPSDGVAAWYQGRFKYSLASAAVQSGSFSQSRWEDFTDPAETNAAVSLGASSAAAHGGVLGDFTAQAVISGDLKPDAYTFASAYQQYVFTVGAHSMLTVSGLASAWTSRSADAGALFDVSGLVLAELSDGSLWSGYRLDSGFNGAGPATGGSQQFWIAYANAGDTPMTVELHFSTDVNARLVDRSVPTPVPEPSGYAMLAGGLLVIGCAGRRRQRHKRG